ncbi:chorismate mutase [Anaerolineales bacterium]
MRVYGVRGATTVAANEKGEILQATKDLLEAMVQVNGILEEDVASILFTTTPDLTAVYPAAAAREMGWHQTALLGFQEAAVDGGLDRCIRILIHWNTDKPQNALQHIFNNQAVSLRPDLSKQKIQQ